MDQLQSVTVAFSSISHDNDGVVPWITHGPAVSFPALLSALHTPSQPPRGNNHFFPILI